LTSDDLSRR